MSIAPLNRVACLGTGAMGSGVAFLAARAGNTVHLYGRTDKSLERGLGGIRRGLDLYAKHGLVAKGEGEDILARVVPLTSLAEAVREADLVMESVAEELDVKQALFAEVEKHAPPHALLATNTSGLAPSDVAKALARPERFLAIHFYNPPYLMPPVEICPTPHTLATVRAAAAAWVTALGNVPIVMEKEMPGYIANRIQCACLREALYIVEQGWATAEMVDKAVSLSLGRRYAATGPIESADMGGLDIFANLLDEVSPDLCKRQSASPLVRDAAALGKLGMKTGEGLFAWPPKKAEERLRAREEMLMDFLRKDAEVSSFSHGKADGQ